jgi:hypothetical protein
MASNRAPSAAKCRDKYLEGGSGSESLPVCTFGYDLPEAGHTQAKIGRLKDSAGQTRQAPVIRNGP